MNNMFLNWYCPNEGQGSRSSILWLCSMIIHSCYSLGNSFEWDGRKKWGKYLISTTLPTNLCFQTVVLEKTLESPLDSKEIKPVNLKENQPWIFTGKTDAESEAPILWPPHGKSWLIGKDPDARKDWGQEEKGGDRGWDSWMASLTQ